MSFVVCGGGSIDVPSPTRAITDTTTACVLCYMIHYGPYRGAVVGLRGAVVAVRGAAVGVRGAAVGNIGMRAYIRHI